MHITLSLAYEQSIYSVFFCLSVCWSGYKRHNCKDFKILISRLLFKIQVSFFSKIPLVNNHLLYEYFGQDTKGINVKMLFSQMLIKKSDSFLWRFIWSMSIYSIINMSICLSVRASLGMDVLVLVYLMKNMIRSSNFTTTKKKVQGYTSSVW